MRKSDLLLCRREPGESKLKFNKIKRQLARWKSKIYPSKPSSQEDIPIILEKPDVYENYGQTMNKAHRLFVGSEVKKNYAFHVFASYAVIDLIKEHISPNERFYLMDGTFKIVPRGCNQLLIISIEYKNDVR